MNLDTEYLLFSEGILYSIYRLNKNGIPLKMKIGREGLIKNVKIVFGGYHGNFKFLICNYMLCHR